MGYTPRFHNWNAYYTSIEILYNPHLIITQYSKKKTQESHNSNKRQLQITKYTLILQASLASHEDTQSVYSNTYPSLHVWSFPFCQLIGSQNSRRWGNWWIESNLLSTAKHFMRPSFFSVNAHKIKVI